ncbi:MAG: hypothetical protein ACXVCP_07550 [Bdellovibrio sp.]
MDLLYSSPTDLNTYYVAISNGVGIQNISRQGDFFRNPNKLEGKWADGFNVTIGEDCTEVTLSLIKLTKNTATIRSSFLAPKANCLSMNKVWMVPSVTSGVPNNFQQVQRSDDKFIVMWGHERFIVNTEIDRASGIIKKASMDNTFTLKMKIGCDTKLENCQSEFPFKIQRNETLQLNN